MEIKIILGDETALAPLFYKYDRQFQPQPAYVELDPEADLPTLRADWSAESGGSTPMREYHGRLFRCACSAYLTAQEIDNLLHEVLPAAQRVMEGYSTRWNDSNEVGMLTDDARDAMIEIDGLCRDYEGTAAVHAVADYFESIVRRSSPQLVNIDLPCTEAPTITPGTSDEVLHEYSVQWREAAESSNAFIEDDIEDWLVSLRDELHA